ncbi:MAG: glycosyltransferase family 2 protein [Firmicutes bacterium]|nr:glycosyltransferase family 2 protein [Bacillota bacterium]
MATVSVCMIVKNEQKVLQRCLESLKGLYEELIIVDTGSTDNTKNIASAYTNKIYDFVWIDDFSAARNFAFSLCTQQYIYTVDADEVLDETNRNKFLLLKQNILPEIEIVQMYYVNSKNENSVYNFQKELRPKLFKRLREFVWIDPIHERVRLQPIVYDSDIEILHMPEGEHTNRDLSILTKLAQQGKVFSDTLFKMYARELFKAGTTQQLTKSKPYFLNALENNILGEKRQICQIILSKIALTENNIHSFFKHCISQKTEGITSEICYLLGEYFYTQNDIEEGLSWYQYALETLPCMDIHCCGDKALFAIAKCFETLGQKQQSQHYMQMAQNWTPPEQSD